MMRAMRDFIAAVVAIARWRFAAVVALITAFSLTEGVGVMLLVPMLRIAGFDAGGRGALGRYADLVASILGSVGLAPTLPVLLAIFAGLIAARAALGRMQSVAMGTIRQEVGLALRRRLYRAISNANWLFLSRSRSVDFVHVLTAEVERVCVASGFVFMFGSVALLAALYLAIAFRIAPEMTMLALGCGALLALALKNRTRDFGRVGADLSADTNRLYAAAVEHLQNLKTARTYGAERRDADNFAALGAEIARTNVRHARLEAGAAAVWETGHALVLVALVYAGIQVFHVAPATLLILLLLFARLMPRLNACHFYYRSIASLIPAFGTVERVEAECLANAEPALISEPGPELSRSVRIEHASFSYRIDSTAPAVNDLNLAIEAGMITAIVGPSGAGKSTTADLLMGLIVPDSGRVTVDGKAIESGVAGWRGQIGYVGQDTFLFHDTVRANLAWARPDASEEEMLAALGTAAAADLVAALPEGLDTVVGDRGMMLSHGERQRIALARAILRRPRLLVLDEATNNLDSANEEQAMAAIGRMRGELTVVLIAHRLSVARWADMIYVIEEGRVAESGGWDRLWAADGPFRAMCERQGIVPSALPARIRSAGAA